MTWWHGMTKSQLTSPKQAAGFMETSNSESSKMDPAIVRRSGSRTSVPTPHVMELRSNKRKRENDNDDSIAVENKNKLFAIEDSHFLNDTNKRCLITFMRSLSSMYSSFDGKILSAQTRAVMEEFVTHLDGEEDIVELGVDQKSSDTAAFRCPHCHSVWIDPITLECGHTYCSECLMKFSPGDTCKKCCGRITCTDIYQSRIDVVSLEVIGKCWPFIIKAKNLRIEAKRCELNHKLNESVAKYSEAIELNNEDHLSWGNRALVQLKMQNFDKALQDSETAIKLSPLWPEGYWRKVSALMKTNQFDEAFVNLTICLYLTKKNKSKGLTVLCTFQEEFVKIVNQIVVQSSGIVVSEIANFHQKAHVQSNSTKNAKIIKEVTNTMADSNERLQKFEMRLHNLIDKTAAALSDLRSQMHLLGAVTSQSRIDEEVKANLSVSDLECSICYRLFLDPVVTPCGHTYCHLCLETCFKHSSDCPMCKKSLYKCLNQRFNVTEFLALLIQRHFQMELEERLRQQAEDNE